MALKSMNLYPVLENGIRGYEVRYENYVRPDGLYEGGTYGHLHPVSVFFVLRRPGANHPQGVYRRIEDFCAEVERNTGVKPYIN